MWLKSQKKLLKAHVEDLRNFNRGWERKFIAVQEQFVIWVNQYSEQIYLLGPLACILQSGIFFSPVAADNQISMHWMVAFWLRDSFLPRQPRHAQCLDVWPSLLLAQSSQGLLVCLAWPARSIIGIYRERIFPLFSSKPIKMFMQYDDVGVLKSWTGQKGKWGLHHLSSKQSHCI